MNNSDYSTAVISSKENEVGARALTTGSVHEDTVSSQQMLHPALRGHPSKLFVETTTRCNLKCQACVKQSSGNGISDGDMSMATFMALVGTFPHLESLVLNGIGEPLLHPLLEEFIRVAKASMQSGSWIGFQSNGSLLTEARATSLLIAGLDRICLSLDSVSCETFRTLRKGGEVADIEHALKSLNSAKVLTGKSELEIGIEVVLRRDNFRELPDVLRWAASRGATFVIATHLLPYDPSQLSQIAYNYNSDQALALYEPWKKKAEHEGLDINRYFDIFFPPKWFRTSEEQRILDYVRQMMRDANKRGIFFQVKNLMERDEFLHGEITGIFNEAIAVAQKIGLSLQLPEIVPKADRKCDFIEGGSAMVSWDGSVHPCYFLWHKFNCYLKRRTACKQIDAKSFGNLENNRITDIWNGPDFKAFRQEVLRYEFSYCTNCNVAPCGFIDSPEFQHDCSSITVPCGDCFWCMGMFHCLQ
jgi:putative metalloenzyme radical SAM/SPASM domain maturase